MRVQKINDNTLRIFLSFNELAERDISMVELFQRSAKTEQLFWEMIAKAGEEVEFVLDQPFWIQATIMSSEEFVITVVKQDSPEDIPPVAKVKPKRRPQSREWVYRFDDWDQLVSLVKELGETVPGRTSLYHCNSAYYLVLPLRGLTGVTRQKVEAILKEYGDKVNLSKIYLEEYGKVVKLETALETIKEYF